LISILLLIISLGFAFLAFFYQKGQAARLTQDKIALAKNKDAFVPGTIEELIRLDTRIGVGKELLTKHNVLSPVFSVLETSVVKTIRLKRFSMSYGEDGSLLLDMSGTAPNFDSVAQQADVFSRSEYLRDIVFSNLSLGGDSSVSFSLKARVVPSILSYVGAISSAQSSNTNTSTQ
ncbi:MAG: hypothetical protein WCW14_04725, partial [Candidatus Paceibacterota bacterium]